MTFNRTEYDVIRRQAECLHKWIDVKNAFDTLQAQYAAPQVCGEKEDNNVVVGAWGATIIAFLFTISSCGASTMRSGSEWIGVLCVYFICLSIALHIISRRENKLPIECAWFMLVISSPLPIVSLLLFVVGCLTIGQDGIWGAVLGGIFLWLFVPVPYKFLKIIRNRPKFEGMNLRYKEEWERNRPLWKKEIEEHEKQLGVLSDEINVLANTGGVSSDFWTPEALSVIIKYFEQGRVENKKEAINLYISEQRATNHYRAVEVEMKKQTYAAEEAADEARLQRLASERAARYARDRAKSAEEVAENVRRIRDKF